MWWWKVEDKEPGFDSSFEAEKRRYEADPWNYWGNPNCPWALEEERRQRRERRRLERGRQAGTPRPVRQRLGGFYARGLDDVDGPADEIEALRARLVAGLGRQPRDVQHLLRSAQALSRMEAAPNRRSADKDHELGGNLLRVLNSMNDPRILPAD